MGIIIKSKRLKKELKKTKKIRRKKLMKVGKTGPVPKGLGIENI